MNPLQPLDPNVQNNIKNSMHEIRWSISIYNSSEVLNIQELSTNYDYDNFNARIKQNVSLWPMAACQRCIIALRQEQILDYTKCTLFCGFEWFYLSLFQNYKGMFHYGQSSLAMTKVGSSMTKPVSAWPKPVPLWPKQFKYDQSRFQFQNDQSLFHYDHWPKQFKYD